ncbi:SDR family NAD(P)-dependent oxidoreductase [Spirosoma pollinicola]|uniref:Oxidoreductase n=1 Tax=Spirosoma pollinicola TaxID=2057025 RepID=A0A2K8YX03_9BACT|nr:SDR family NAD(P)-dependent oxidoreductase [Spirosoma pollinicola]AUD02129.1 oxidoreductase [Spirosoma pollinicola]
MKSTQKINIPTKDKVFLITGGTSGVGQAIATGVAASGAKVLIISRTEESGQQGVRHIAEATGNDKAEFLVADLSLLSSIRSASEEFKRRYDNLHVLVNAAGALYFDQQFTVEGNEMTFAVNYLSHFYLTNQLLDVLKASAPARVVTVGVRPAFLKNPTLNLQDLQLTQDFSGLKATSQATIARHYFVFTLARRLAGTGVSSVAFYPSLVKSRLAKNAPWWLKVVTGLMEPWAKATCDIGVYLATAPEVAQETGVFFDDNKQLVPLHTQYDPAIGEKLWHLSEQLTGIAVS